MRRAVATTGGALAGKLAGGTVQPAETRTASGEPDSPVRSGQDVVNDVCTARVVQADRPVALDLDLPVALDHLVQSAAQGANEDPSLAVHGE